MNIVNGVLVGLGLFALVESSVGGRWRVTDVFLLVAGAFGAWAMFR